MGVKEPETQAYGSIPHSPGDRLARGAPFRWAGRVPMTGGNQAPPQAQALPRMRSRYIPVDTEKPRLPQVSISDSQAVVSLLAQIEIS